MPHALLRFLVASIAVAMCLGFPSVAKAVDTPRDPVEGRWWGEIGPERDRIAAGLEFTRRADGGLDARLTQPLMNLYGVDVGGGVVRDGDRVEIASLALSLTLQDGRLLGHFPGPRSPAAFERVESLPSEPPPPAVPTGPGPRWSVRLGGQAYATPAVADGVAYVGSTGGVVTAVDTRTGEPVWATAVGFPVFGEATLDAAAVYVVSDGGFLHKLARADGKELWRYDLGGGGQGRVLPHPLVFDWDWQSPRPVLRDGGVFVGSADGSFHAVDAASGQRRWRQPGDSRIRTGAAVDARAVVFGDHAGHVHALDPRTGETRWTAETGAPVDAIPVLHDGLAIVGNRGYGLYAFALADGAERWKTYFWGSWVESGAVVADGRLYVGSSDQRRVSALSPADGRVLWRSDVRGWSWGTPLVLDDVVYAGSAGGTPYFIRHEAGLNVLARDDGRLLARWPLADAGGHQWGIAGSPVVSGDTVVVATIEGSLLGFPRFDAGAE